MHSLLNQSLVSQYRKTLWKENQRYNVHRRKQVVE